MIYHPGIVRAAKLLMDKYGEDAPMRAMRRAGELLDDGDIDGTMVWSQILEAIEELQLVGQGGQPAT
jgi:hypothetical protein